MRTHFQVTLQSGAMIAATAKLEKKSNDTNGVAAENVIWCPSPGVLWVIQDETGEGAPKELINQSID